MYIPTTTLTQGSGYSELAYVEITSIVTSTQTTEAAADVVVTAGAFTADGTSAILIEFWATAWEAPSDGTVNIALYENGASIGRWAAASFLVSGAETILSYSPVYAARRIIPASGSRTYSVRLFGSAGTKTVYAGAGGSGNDPPAFIRITKVT